MATVPMPFGVKMEFTAACPSKPGETVDQLTARMLEAGIPADRIGVPEPHPSDPNLFMIPYIYAEG